MVKTDFMDLYNHKHVDPFSLLPLMLVDANFENSGNFGVIKYSSYLGIKHLMDGDRNSTHIFN